MAIKIENKEVVLGVDYGERNIGLAFGVNGVVSPLKIISGKNDETAINDISRVALENRVKKIIMGLPLTHDNKETFQTRKVRRFSKLLKIKLKLPVEFVNEYRSTEEIIEEAIEIDLPLKRRGSIDDLSAALIVKRYFNS